MPGIPNSGAAGSVLDAVNTGLVRVEGPAFWTPGASGNFLSTPSSSTLQIVGDVEIVVRVAALDWTPSTYMILAGKDYREYEFLIGPSGRFEFNASNGVGGSVPFVTNVGYPAFVDGVTYWLKVAYDENNGSGNRTASFYWAADQETEPAAWTLVQVVTVAGLVAEVANTFSVAVSARPDGSVAFQGVVKRAIIRNGIGGSTVFDVGGSDVPAPDALTFQAKTGQTVTVSRSASGPVTTIVPAGAVVYVNPDSGVAANRMETPDDGALDVAANEDAVIVWVGQKGNQTAGQKALVKTNTTNTNNNVRLFDFPGGDGVAAQIIDAVWTFSQNNSTGGIKHKVMVAIGVVDRAASSIRTRTYTDAGLLAASATVTPITAGALIPTNGLLALSEIPGAVSAFMWNKGVGIAPTDAQCAVIARRLLVQATRPAVNVTGTVPPISPVYGDRWRASNGHVAFYDGAQWTAVSPSAGVNVAVLLGNATLWLDAAGSTVGEQYARNRGLGGEALNARYGSTASADTNDPLFLPHSGENYVALPGRSGDSLSIPNAAATNITGDIEIVVAGWVPPSLPLPVFQALVSNWSSAGVNGWELGVIGTSHLLQFVYDATVIAASDAPLPMVANSAISIKMTRAAGTGVVKFYMSTNYNAASKAGTWTQLGSDRSTPAGNMNTPTAPLHIGLRPGSEVGAGSFAGAEVKNAIGGTRVFDFVAATSITSGAATSFVATSGQTITVNRSATGRKTVLVTRPIWLHGTDDYLEIPDNPLLDFAAGESFTVIAVARVWATSVTNGVLVSKVNLGLLPTPGWQLYTEGSAISKFLVGDATNFSFVAGSTSGLQNLTTLIGIRNVAADTVGAAANNVTPTTANEATSGTIANSDPVRVGTGVGGNSPIDAEIVAVIVLRRAATTAEIAAIVSYYGTV